MIVSKGASTKRPLTGSSHLLYITYFWHYLVETRFHVKDFFFFLSKKWNNHLNPSWSLEEQHERAFPREQKCGHWAITPLCHWPHTLTVSPQGWHMRRPTGNVSPLVWPSDPHLKLSPSCSRCGACRQSHTDSEGPPTESSLGTSAAVHLCMTTQDCCGGS